jgi:sugar (pentulose or hexulose) kinase
LAAGAYIVADFGKTTSKLTLWSKNGAVLHRTTRANTVQNCGQYRSLDIEGTGRWLIESLKSFANHPVEAIIPVAHGAAVLGLRHGAVAFPPLDYEQPIPNAVTAAYRKCRDPFAMTGSPALPDGLNMGCQLAWLEQLHGEGFTNSVLLPYAQYWAWLLSGVMRSEITSLGCHTDLWAPDINDFSPLAKARGWSAQFAPLAAAGDKIGTLRPDIAALTGLAETVSIHTGLHDSNAALLAARNFPEIANKDATILSTGTWFIAMRSPALPIATRQLADSRDCLVNIDAFGQAVPSARFMGGREIEMLIGINTDQVDLLADQDQMLAAVQQVVDDGTMALPNFAPGNGPFQSATGRWIHRPQNGMLRRAAACLYAALVAKTSLSLIGSKDILLVEGRFAKAGVFVRALAQLCPDLAVYTANKDIDVSFGALRLINPALRPNGVLRRVLPLDVDLSSYTQKWHEALI